MKNKRKKILISILSVLSCLIIILIVLGCVYYEDLKTVRNVKELENDVFSVKIDSDYEIDTYLKKGATSYSQLLKLGKKRYYPFGNVTTNKYCSSFFSKNEEGDILLCHNIDNDSCVPVVVKLNHGVNIIGIGNGKGIISSKNKGFFNKYNLNFIPYRLYGGMNEYGLSIVGATDGDSYCDDSQEKTLLESTIVVSVLNKAKTVSEAFDFLKNFNLSNDKGYIGHFMCADKNGNCSIFEWHGSVMELKISKEYIIMSNFNSINNPSMRGFGVDRYNNYDAYLSEKTGIVEEDEALNLLKKNVIPGDECFSEVYNLTKGTLKVTFASNYDNVYDYNI